MQENYSVRRALLSVSNKNGILEFAKKLSNRGIELLATGGTANLLINANLPVIEISKYTGFPEIMDGRLKTLHPKIHGGILGRRGTDNTVMKKNDIEPIDMIIVNLYPFAETITKPDSTLEDAIDNIDIGGSAMIRGAAKNYKDIIVLVNNKDYNSIIFELDAHNNSVTFKTRLNLAIKAFEYITEYDNKIVNYLKNKRNFSTTFPSILNINFIKKQNIRYGENSHQKAAFYTEKNFKEASVSTAKQVQGKSLSYNNIADTDTALECVKEFTEPACVIVKHSNPCGVAVRDSILDAYKCAYKTDPVSAFGGIIALNRGLDEMTAEAIINNQFVEVIITPYASKAALKITSIKHNIRILICGYCNNRIPNLDFKRVKGGLLVQDYDLQMIHDNKKLEVVTKNKPNQKELNDALFCWKVARFVKSNAIVYARNNMTIGIGSGQTSRIYSVKIANMKANDEGFNLNGASMASDAFFPFRDSIDMAASVGIKCVIQPGGSIRDHEVIAAANEHNMSMIFTKVRHFRH